MPRSLRSTVVAALLGAALGAGGLLALADPPRGGFAPDPLPHQSRAHWIFEISAQGGKVAVDRVKAIASRTRWGIARPSFCRITASSLSDAPLMRRPGSSSPWIGAARRS